MAAGNRYLDGALHLILAIGDGFGILRQGTLIAPREVAFRGGFAVPVAGRSPARGWINRFDDLIAQELSDIFDFPQSRTRCACGQAACAARISFSTAALRLPSRVAIASSFLLSGGASKTVVLTCTRGFRPDPGRIPPRIFRSVLFAASCSSSARSVRGVRRPTRPSLISFSQALNGTSNAFFTSYFMVCVYSGMFPTATP